MKIVMVIFCLSFSVTLSSQEKCNNYEFVEFEYFSKNATISGQKSYWKFLYKNFKIPVEDRTNATEGTVTIHMNIDGQGKVQLYFSHLLSEHITKELIRVFQLGSQYFKTDLTCITTQIIVRVKNVSKENNTKTKDKPHLMFNYMDPIIRYSGCG